MMHATSSDSVVEVKDGAGGGSVEQLGLCAAGDITPKEVPTSR